MRTYLLWCLLVWFIMVSLEFKWSWFRVSLLYGLFGLELGFLWASFRVSLLLGFLQVFSFLG